MLLITSYCHLLWSIHDNMRLLKTVDLVVDVVIVVVSLLVVSDHILFSCGQ